MYRRFFKRLTDIVFSAAALLFLSPIMLIVALLIKLEDGESVFFRQSRVGRNGAEFEVLKFRSMSVDAPNVESALAEAMPITRIGRLIRRTNIDELPQLINILRGDMSIVGPRPPLPSQQALVHLRGTNGAITCAPGLTGLAQINGYDGMPDEEKAGYDGEYAANVSFLTDCSIVVRTFGYLAKRPPVY